MKKYSWILFLATLIALLALLGFQTIWVVHGSAAPILTQVGLQRTREEHMVKDVLVLAYRTNTLERTAALSELQDTLPLWETAQRGLQVGDASLNLPRHPAADILLLLIQTQPDYTAMDVAFQKIVAHTEQHPDPAQLQILMDHERSYFVLMSNVTTLWQQRIDEVFVQLFWIESGLVGIITALVILNFVFTMRNYEKGRFVCLH